MFERVVGPFKGYYIASYACAMGELGNQYLGYAKVCAGRPRGYFDADGVAKVCGDKLTFFPLAALDDAEYRARLVIENSAVLEDCVSQCSSE